MMQEPVAVRGGITCTVAVVALAMTFALVLMGALVTNNEAGDSVPDWPLAWGQVVPADHLSGKVVFEYTHRLIAGLVGACTLLLTVLVLVREKRPAPKVLAAAALLLVIAQALLGGISVRLGETHSYGVAMIHAFTAQLFLGTLSATLLSLSPAWNAAAPRRAKGDVTTSGNLVVLGFAAVGAVLLQILLGAGFRHRVLGVIPHAVDAVLVVVLVALLASAFRRRGSGRHLVFSRMAAVALGAQLILGVVIYLLIRTADTTTQTAAATVIIAVLHLGFGSALLFASVGCAFWTLRAPTAARGT